MKKIILLLLILLMLVTGCGKALNAEDFNQKLTDYFSSDEADYSNLIYHYADTNNNKVVVGLEENTKKMQEDLLNKVYTKKEVKKIKKKNLFDFKDSNREEVKNLLLYTKVEEKIDEMVANAPQDSSIPYDYVTYNMDIFRELASDKDVTFKASIKNLIEKDASEGIKSYIEAVLCKEINENITFEFVSEVEFLNKYTNYLKKTNDDKLNEYDKYAKSLLEKD